LGRASGVRITGRRRGNLQIAVRAAGHTLGATTDMVSRRRLLGRRKSRGGRDLGRASGVRITGRRRGSLQNAVGDAGHTLGATASMTGRRRVLGRRKSREGRDLGSASGVRITGRRRGGLQKPIRSVAGTLGTCPGVTSRIPPPWRRKSRCSLDFRSASGVRITCRRRGGR
jgi:hypothetical protein